MGQPNMRLWDSLNYILPEKSKQIFGIDGNMQLLSMCGIFFCFLFQRKYATIFFNPLSSMKHYCHGPGTHVKSMAALLIENGAKE
jgi:hypothetical protein